MIDANDKKEELRRMISYLERFVEFHKNRSIHLIDATSHMSEMLNYSQILKSENQNV